MSDSEQRKLALDPTKSWCVTAPAGSGKTSLLVQRILALLIRVEEPEEIVAITFTRKAAAEMRLRVHEAFELVQTRQRASLPSYEQVTYDLAAKVLEHSDSRSWSLQHNLNRLQITTIDSFCASLVRQLPLLSHLGGPITPTDDPNALFRTVAIQILSTEDPNLKRHLLPILHALGNRWESAVDWLVTLLSKRDQWQLALFPKAQADTALERMNQTWRDICAQQVSFLAEVLAPYLARLTSILQSLEEDTTNKSGSLWDPISGVGAWQRVCRFLLTDKDQWREKIDKRQGFPPGSEQKLLWEELMPEIRSTVSPNVFAGLRFMPAELANDESWQLVVNVVSILPHLQAQFWMTCQQENQVDFTQIADGALAALGDDDAPTDLSLSLDYRLKHLLIDEFQDTSTVQFELVRRLTRDWLEYNESNAHHPKTLFLVGDAMQSIYRFRGAQVDLFIRAQEVGFNGLLPGRLKLDQNFRSRPEIVDWVNGIFARSVDLSPPFVQTIQANKARSTRASGGTVELHGFSGPAAAVEEQDFIAEQVRAWMEDHPGTSVGVLARSRSHLVTVASTLRVAGIPFNAVEIERIEDNQALHDLISFIRFTVQPHDWLVCAGTLRAPWAAWSLQELQRFRDWCAAEEERDLVLALVKFLRLYPDLTNRSERCVAALTWARATRCRRNPATWIEEIIRRLNLIEIYPSSGDQLALDELLTAVENHPELVEKPWLISEHLASRAVSVGHADASVSLLTMHKSKGLEFDCVILPAMTRTTKSNSRQLFEWSEVSHESGYGFLIGNAKSDGGIGEWLYQRDKAADLCENERLAYVAFTRARERLLITASWKTEDDTSSLSAPESSMLGRIWRYIAQDVRWHESREAGQSPLVSRVTGLWRYQSRSRTDGLVSVTTSTSAAEAPLALTRSNDEIAAAVGTLVHKAFEQALKTACLPRADFVLSSWNRERLLRSGFTQSQIDRICDRARAVVEGASGAAWSEWVFASGEWMREPEVRIKVTLNDETVTRVVDLILQNKMTQELWVLDFKTGVRCSDESETAFRIRLAGEYEAQLGEYRAAVEGVFGIKPRMGILSTDLQELIELLPSPSC